MRIKKNATTEEKFFAYVIKKPGCWGWGNSSNNKGYGTVNVKKNDGRWVPFLAHRLSWIIHNGPIPDGLEVCHHCDNPVCTNPEHLFLGTHKENFSDQSKKGRSPLTGAKINYEIACQIREEYTGRRGEQRVLAAKYGITQPQISVILSGRQWKRPQGGASGLLQ